nr:AAA family ATPase [uncultured Psychroserpens sp.]
MMNDTTEKIKSLSEAIKGDEAKLIHGTSNSGCLIVKPANAWIEEAKLRPIPKMLFGEFWFEGEVSVLFADTNVGKSILAVQIGDSISKGQHIEGFKLEVPPKKVAYLDFELSDKQFEKRYSDNYTNHYHFHDNFLRAEIDPEAELPKEFESVEEHLNHSFSSVIEDSGAEVLIIDNITFLKSDNERAKDALLIMKHLKQLNRAYGISILVLAHTPKRNSANPLTKNDLAGSKMLMNFCDSAFAIGESASEPDIRYLKQIKQRNTEKIYNDNNVVMTRIAQPLNFLKFEFIGFGNETEHLRKIEMNDIEDRDVRIHELKEKGLPNTEIAKELGISEGTVRNRLKKIA